MEAKLSFGLATILIVFCHFRLSEAHGHLTDPPARSSMWREGYKTPRNYNDNQLNCGGYYTQWGLNNGKCGICGDPYQNAQPRDNESGGRFGKGIVTRTYQQGQVVTLKVLITANHLGWFEFRLCPDGSPTKPVTQSCLDRYLLQMADGSGTRYELGSRYNTVSVKVKLPDGLTCKQCVLQWRWHAGNSFGQDSQGNWCKGCGSQEEFYGCADVAISTSGQVSNPGTQPTLAPITNAPITNAPITFAPVTNAPITYAPVTNSPITFAPITNAPITYAPITNAPFTAGPPNTPRPYNTLFPPITYRPITNAPITAAPPNTPRPYFTFPPATYRPVTNPPVNPQTSGPLYPTFRPISFPYFTTSPTRPTTAGNSGNSNLPSGFLPISLAPGSGPARTQTPLSTRYPFFRPPTTASPKSTSRSTTPRPIFTFFPPITTSPRPQNPMTTRRPGLPTNFFRPPTTTPSSPVTFTFRPQTTLRPITPRPTQPTTYKPLVFTVVRHTTSTTNTPSTTTTTTTTTTRQPTQTPSTTTPKPTTPPTTQQPIRTPPANRCFGINSWQGVPELDAYCNAQCQMVGGQCPSAFCGCA